ncbi:hypothetical protein M408DRAFT_75670, partial [Serendipita vermifera MAFF 305830]
IWDATTGAPVGEPLKGHTEGISSVAYSPNSQHVVSGSRDQTIRIWDATTGVPVGEPLKGHTNAITSVAYSPNDTSMLFNLQSLSHCISDHKSSIHPVSTSSTARTGVGIGPELIDDNGWVRSSEGLLFWIPEDCRSGLTCPATLIIPSTGRYRRVRLNFASFQYGPEWTNVCGDV